MPELVIIYVGFAFILFLFRPKHTQKTLHSSNATAKGIMKK